MSVSVDARKDGSKQLIQHAVGVNHKVAKRCMAELGNGLGRGESVQVLAVQIQQHVVYHLHGQAVVLPDAIHDHCKLRLRENQPKSYDLITVEPC